MTSFSPPKIEGDKNEDEHDSTDYTAYDDWVGVSTAIGGRHVDESSWDEHFEMSVFERRAKARFIRSRRTGSGECVGFPPPESLLDCVSQLFRRVKSLFSRVKLAEI
jgi:hypothetical protein